MVSLLPAAACVATALAALFYNIDPQLEKRIGVELSDRRAVSIAQ
jgi:Na+/melibiose symporter-like transporter